MVPIDYPDTQLSLKFLTVVVLLGQFELASSWHGYGSHAGADSLPI